MVIVAGRLFIDPAGRDGYLAGCVEVMRTARSAPGCVDFTVTADPLDPGRINVFEQWESREAVEAFRGDGPSQEQTAALSGASVAEYDIAEVRTLV